MEGVKVASWKNRTYIYRAQSGDTLSSIAKEYYGDAGKYMDIFNANTDSFLDPNKIQVGGIDNSVSI